VGANIRRLVPVEGSAANKELVLRSGRQTLGRAPRNDFVLNDAEVSKLHVELVVTGEKAVLRDLGSSNGTFVNGESITERELKAGDRVAIGCSEFKYEVELESRRSTVTIVAMSPIDKTQVLAASQIESLRPAIEISDQAALRRSYERVRTAFDAVGMLIETTDIQLLCRRILEVAFNLVKAETGAVMLFDAERELVPWATRGAAGEEVDGIQISRTIVDQVIREQSAVLASDALSDSRWSSAESVVLSGVRSLMCVPLLSAHNVYGLLHVGNSKTVAAFSQSDLELMTGIGTGAGVALSNAFMNHRLVEEARTRESLGRFLSPVLVDQVLQDRVDMKRGGEEREVTVMFADIRGFTSLTERSRAQDVVSLLNEYFDQMVEIIFQHGGALDKYIGDAIMAVWGTPVSQPDDGLRALAAACEMQQVLQSLNAMREDRNEEPIAIGIGLASGVCVSGAIGARRRMEYTVIGDAVNLASRFAGIAKAGEVLCDKPTFERAGKPKASESLPLAQVKGKHKPVPVFRISRV